MARHYGTPMPTCAAGAVRRRHGGALVWYCLGILTGYVTVSGASPAVTAEAQKWAMVILSAIASGLIGFLTGKAIK